jgi:hypothetical protein
MTSLVLPALLDTYFFFCFAPDIKSGQAPEKVTKRKGDFFLMLRMEKRAMRCYARLYSSEWR